MAVSGNRIVSPRVQTLVQDGMRIEVDVPVDMDDGAVLRADVFRPLNDSQYPVLLTMGPYGKGLWVPDGFPENYEHMVHTHPEIQEDSSNKYLAWETVDPEKWVPHGFVCVRVDSRGAGRSPGILDPWSPQEARDLAACIEWAGTQPWSNGRVGLIGISYYAMNQWHVAALQPPHLAAMVVQEGAADFYRDVTRHGGILSTFLQSWFRDVVLRVQHGIGDRGFRSVVTGDTVAGPETLTDQEMAAQRVDPYPAILERPLDGPYYRDRSVHSERVVTPLLSLGNWGGQGLHLRGNVEGFLHAASTRKWLEMHGGSHFAPFYSRESVALQRKFLGYFLKDEETGWEADQPRVSLHIRHVGEKFVPRAEGEWPLRRTKWTKKYLNSSGMTISGEYTPSSPCSFDANSSGVRFISEPLVGDTEITGPIAAKLFLSSSTADADVFVTFQVFDPEGNEITFQGSNDPRTPIALGWLRASHRELDETLSLPFRPFHRHSREVPLRPGSPVELDIELWPTCLVVPAGYRIALQVSGQDYDNGGENPQFRGVGPFVHNDPIDRPEHKFGGIYTLHFEEDRAPYLLLPIIPE